MLRMGGPRGVAGVTTNLLWDETSSFGDVVLESTQGGGSVSYSLGADGELISQNRGSGPAFYLTDGRRNVTALADSTGTITDTYRFDAYGNLLNSQGSTVNNYQYRSQQTDAASGLQYLRARYYSPKVGRFLSRDIAAYRFDDPVEINRYTYAAADPINGFDPLGLADLIEEGEAQGNVEQKVYEDYRVAYQEEKGLACLYAVSRARILQALLLWDGSRRFAFGNNLDKIFSASYLNYTVAAAELLLTRPTADPIKRADEYEYFPSRLVIGISRNGVSKLGNSSVRDTISGWVNSPEQLIFGTFSGVDKDWHAERMIISNAVPFWEILSIGAGWRVCWTCQGVLNTLVTPEGDTPRICNPKPGIAP